jgi:NUMOD3 motif
MNRAKRNRSSTGNSSSNATIANERPDNDNSHLSVIVEESNRSCTSSDAVVVQPVLGAATTNNSCEPKQKLLSSSMIQKRPPRKKPKTIKIEKETSDSETKKLLRRVDFDAEDEDLQNWSSTQRDDVNATLSSSATAAAIVVGLLDDVRPTALRLTERGGYSHTKQSRMKISQANQGKSPWNKGKERTESAKAKISAGVKARNHMLLLKKLELLNMTEEEWCIKKRQIKLLRERVRKAKIAATKYEQEQLELRQPPPPRHPVTIQVEDNSALAAFDNLDDDNDDDDDDDSENSTNEHHAQQQQQQQQQKCNVAANSTLQFDDVAHSSAHTSTPVSSLEKESKQPHGAMSIFTPDIQWTPHFLDAKDIQYDMLCPHGGPGGLICCHSCSVQYTKYMNATFHDLERQVTVKIGNEVQELLRHTSVTKQQLLQTMKVARRKPIPIRQHNASSRNSSLTNRSAVLLDTSKAVDVAPVIGNTVARQTTDDSGHTTAVTRPTVDDVPVIQVARSVLDTTNGIPPSMDFPDVSLDFPDVIHTEEL